MVPSLITPSIQKILLSRLIHRDLSLPHHQTNLHLHHDLPYPERDHVIDEPQSFFTHSPDSDNMFIPKDPTVHKPLSMKQVMERRLHWATLGGQYDWTKRVYPGEVPPSFPEDVAGLLETLFPETLAQAAIVNFYTPGDTMMMHRDVSEETDKGLVSVSMGCDALFSMSFTTKHHVLALCYFRPYMTVPREIYLTPGASDRTQRCRENVRDRKTCRRGEALLDPSDTIWRCHLHDTGLTLCMARGA